MIKKNELKLINEDYFCVIGKNAYTVTLRSKCTGHFWHIELAEYPNYRNYKLYHKHNISNPYHRHSDRPSLQAVLNEIVGHDKFQMNGRKY